MQPMFRVTGVDGAVVVEGPGGRALALEVTDEDGRLADTLTVIVDDRNAEIAVPSRGAQLTCSLGYKETGMVQIGTYVVDEVILAGWPRQLEVVAHAIDMQGPMKQGRTQDYHHKSLSQIIGEVASRSGLSAAASGKVGAFKYEHLAQTEESDMHFVTRLAQKHNAIGKVTNGRLVFTDRGTGMSVSGAAMGSATARYPDNVIEYRATFQGRSDFMESEGAYWDGEKAERIEQRVSSGIAGAGAAAASISNARSKLPPMWSDGVLEALNAAQGRADKNAMDVGTLEITIIGEPGVAAGGPLQVINVRPDVDGTWHMTKVTHFIDTSGYVTVIEAKLGAG